MGEFFESFKNEVRELLQNEQVLGLANKKHLVSILILGILILAIPIGMELLKNQRMIRSRASGDPIAFVESDDVFQKDGKWFTKSKSFSVQITSPLGPAVASGSSFPAPTSPAETAVPTARPTSPAETAVPTARPTSPAETAVPTSSSSPLTNLTYTCSSDNSKVNLSWDIAAGAIGYVLRLNRIDGPGDDWNNPTGDINNPADRYISVNNTASGGKIIVNSLKVNPGKEYAWTVQVNGRTDQNPGPKFTCGTLPAGPQTTVTLSKSSNFVNGETITLNFQAAGGTINAIHTSVWEGITDPSQKTGGGNYQGFSGSTGSRTAKVPFYVEWLAVGSLGYEDNKKPKSLLVKP
ncbi:hypothetical protein HYU93_00550 [Candidatus Daviesbacteria bacterium]|nr:hypothetical protein [Candidatus Daviesbacteria bacterium]